MSSQIPDSSTSSTAGNSPETGQVRVSFHVAPIKPWVTYVLMGASILFFGLQQLSTYLTGHDLPYILGGKVNELILQGQIWRLITPILLHGSILHIAFNMYALYIFGPGLERYYGHWRYLLLYLLGGYCGNVLSFLLSPNPSIGASTAIFALVAAEIIFIYRNRILFGSRAKGISSTWPLWWW
jgi:rhomboid protease GluP